MDARGDAKYLKTGDKPKSKIDVAGKYEY